MNRPTLSESEKKHLTSQVQERLIQNHRSLFLEQDSGGALDRQEAAIRREVRSILDREDPETENYVIDRLIGYKDLGPLFRDPEVSDILINGPGQVYIEKNNRPILTGVKFESSEEVMRILHLAVLKAGRKIDFSRPIVNVQLPDGSRLNAVIVPNCPFPAISIRKFIKRRFTGEDLVSRGFIGREMLLFFEYTVRAGCNIIVCGATGSGKTTFLRFLCSFIPGDERIVTIEDTYELNLEGHVVPLQKSNKADIRELMENALRMYPRRIILGEFRGEETFELLQAMGTGHMGSMTTGHANNGRHDLVQRLIRAMSRSGLTDDELTRHIISAVDLTVFIKKFRDGKWCVTEVNELVDNKGKPGFKEIYRHNRSAGRHEAAESLSLSLLERLQDELGNEKLPNIKPFSGLHKPKGVVAACSN